MITEDYVSFEVAKLLKEKGFNVPFYFFYRTDDKSIHHVVAANPLIYCDKIDDEVISAPSLSMAMKWLRKVHNIHIAIVPCEVGPGVMDYTYILYKVDTENFIFNDLEIQGRANTDKMSASKTCEAAIKYCLENLI